MQFTLRQRQRLTLFGGLWVLLTALCAVAGPFGTSEAMGILGRAGYWGLIAGISILGSLWISRFDGAGASRQITAWACYVLGLFGLVMGLNWLLFSQRPDVPELGYLFVIISLSVAAIYGMIHLARKAMSIPENVGPSVDPQARFLRRLPIEVRAPLIRIEAQDHYLNVVTVKGSALILLRLAEAVEELIGAGGVQTHRSHWVKIDAVTHHKRTQGRDVLILSDGATVPVARTRRDAVRAAGLF